MPEALTEFGPVQEIQAQALGVPGQRTFRLLIRAEAGQACLWLEKEQLQQLALHIESLISRTRPPLAETEAVTLGPPPEPPFQVEFHIGLLSIGVADNAQSYAMQVWSLDDDEDDPPRFGCWISPAQIRRLGEQAQEVVAAGRPRCVLCGDLMEAGHACIRQNGHRLQT